MLLVLQHPLLPMLHFGRVMQNSYQSDAGEDGVVGAVDFVVGDCGEVDLGGAFGIMAQGIGYGGGWYTF